MAPRKLMSSEIKPRLRFALLILACGSGAALAADAPEVRTTTLLDHLDKPCGVAVQPSGNVYVSEGGAGRIVRTTGPVSATRKVTAETAISGFPRGAFDAAAN